MPIVIFGALRPAAAAATHTAATATVATAPCGRRIGVALRLGPRRIVDQQRIQRQCVRQDPVSRVVAADRQAIQRNRITATHRELDVLEMRVHLYIDTCISLLVRGSWRRIAKSGSGMRRRTTTRCVRIACCSCCRAHTHAAHAAHTARPPPAGLGTLLRSWRASTSHVGRTSHCSMHNRPVLQLDRDALIVELHQKAAVRRHPLTEPTSSWSQRNDRFLAGSARPHVTLRQRVGCFARRGARWGLLDCCPC